MRITFRSFIFTVLATLTFMCVCPAAPVAPSHRVYVFLQRMQNKGHLQSVFLQSLPWEREVIINVLKNLPVDKMSVWESFQIKSYLKEFDADIRQQSSKLVFKQGGRELIGSGSFFTAVHSADSLPERDLYGFGMFGAQVEGQVNNTLRYVSQVSMGQELSLDNTYQENYTAQRGLPYSTPGKAGSQDSVFNSATFDAYRVVISLYNPRYRLDVAHDWNQWGPGIWQHPSLSQTPYMWVQDSITPPVISTYTGYNYYGSNRHGYFEPGESSPITQFRGVVDWGWLKYTKFFGRKTALSHDTSSYITGQRLESSYGNFSGGVYELLTFTRDQIEWSYALPLASLYIVEHFLGDKDNVAIGADIQWVYPGLGRFYFELFLDDLVSPQAMFKDFGGNKLALVLGTELPDLIFNNSNTQIEYARVEPWVYTHHIPNNQMQHYGSLLGSSLLPNSHMLNFRHTQFLAGGWTTSGAYSMYQHQHIDPGSNILDSFNALTDQNKNFLGDKPETRHTLTFTGSYNWERYLSLSTYLGYQFTRNHRSTPGTDISGAMVGGSMKLVY